MPISNSSVKVYLFRTSDYSLQNFIEVYNLLKTLSIKMEVILTNPDKEYVWEPYESFKNDTLFIEHTKMGYYIKDSVLDQFSKHFFEKQRASYNIKKDGFTVVLTNDWINDNYFSCYDLERNIIVRTSDWGKYSEVKPKYSIAFVIVENIINTLQKIDFNPHSYSFDNLPKIENKREYRVDGLHKIIKDFFGRLYSAGKNKKSEFSFNIEDLLKSYKELGEIALEIKTSAGDDSSIKIFADSNADLNTLKQLFKLIAKLYEESNGKLKLPDNKLSNLILKEDGIIFLQEKNESFDFGNLWRTLYVFFLICPFEEGIKAKELINYKSTFIAVYNAVNSHSKEDNEVMRDVYSILNLKTKSFSEKKSLINTEITEKLSNPIAFFYRIEGKPRMPFKINLPKNLIENKNKKLQKISFLPDTDTTLSV
jgi:hypothetical protein